MLGRLVFELYPELAPKTCTNFLALCGKESGGYVGWFLAHCADKTVAAVFGDVSSTLAPFLGAGAFLGAKSTVLGNIHVGEGATIAASALVNKPVPPRHVATGVPAKCRPVAADMPQFAPSGAEMPPDAPYGELGEGI